MTSNEPARQRITELSRLLRGVGALVVLAAASTFLLQRWSLGDDLHRSWTLLAHTALLAAVGFACGIAIREDKGARTFLGLALAMVPVHFTVLGALVYSVFGEPPAGLPSYASWVAPGPGAVALGVAGNLAVLTPISAVALLALARPAAWRLLPLLLPGHAVLLIPTRDPDHVAALVLALAPVLGWFELRVVPRHASLHTAEGRYARLVLAAPVAMLIARNVHLYELSYFLSAALCFAVGLASFIQSRKLSAPRRAALEGLTLGALAGACSCHAVGLRMVLELPPAALLPIAALSYAVAAASLSVLMTDLGPAYRLTSASAAILGIVLNVLIFPGPLTSWLCVATSVAVIAYSAYVRQRMVLLTGAFGLLVGLSQQLHYAVDLFHRSQWIALALLGSTTILAASLLERHHERLGLKLHALRSELSTWQS